MIFNLMKPVPVQTATMYSYNGTVLPALPVWDKETYPYAVMFCATTDNIVGGSYYGRLYLCANPVTVSEGKLAITGECLRYLSASTEELLSYMEMLTGGSVSEANKWEYADTQADTTLSILSYCWCNHDIVNADGTLYYESSEPVPVYE